MSENERRARSGRVVRELSKAGFDVMWCSGCWRIVRAKKRGFGLKCAAPSRKQAYKLTCLASAANTIAKRQLESPDDVARFARNRQTDP